MTPRRLLARAIEELQSCGCATPRLDAELLLAHALGKSRSWLIAHADDTLQDGDITRFEAMQARRIRREPLAYITGEKEFWSRPFHVTPDVLIPRPETEHLIEAVLKRFPEQQAAYAFCDIGTGSGCIAVTLACEYPRAHVTATDISPGALAVARLNAERHGVSERMNFLQGNLFAALGNGRDRSKAATPFDAIVSNPPYVGEQEIPGLEPELDFEPRHALSDGQDGLSYLCQLVDEAGNWLTPHGLLIVETGLCGLPDDGRGLRLQSPITDLAGLLRGGIYGR